MKKILLLTALLMLLLGVLCVCRAEMPTCPFCHVEMVWTKDATYHYMYCPSPSNCGTTKCRHIPTPSENYVYDATGHYQTCTKFDCPYKINEAAHTGTWISSGTTHNKKCACGYILETHTAAFTWETDDNNGCFGSCTVSDCTCSNYSWHQYAWTADGTAHKKACTLCGYTKTTHTGAAASAYSGNSDKHWNACTTSGCTVKLNEGEHTFAYVSSGDTHSYTCSVCGYEDTSKSHACQYGSWTEDGGNHKRTCQYSGCGLTEQHAPQIEPGVYGYTADNHYNTCQYSGCGLNVNQTAHSCEWTQSGSQHSYVCVCGYSDSSKAHAAQYGAWTEEGGNHTRVCQYSGCGFTEQHAAQIDPNVYSFDADSHRNACQGGCGLFINQTAHSCEWTESGSEHVYVCVCGYEDTAKAHPCSGGAWQLNADETLCFTGCTYSGCTLGESHTPAPKAEFGMDASSHWHNCSAEGCTNRLEVTPHTMMWYPTPDGYSYLCGVCGYHAKDINGNSTEIKAGEKLVMWRSEWIIVKVEDGMVTMVSAEVYDPAKYAGIEGQLKDGMLLPGQMEFLAEPACEAGAEYADEYFDGEAGHIQICLPMGRMESQMIYNGRVPE